MNIASCELKAGTWIMQSGSQTLENHSLRRTEMVKKFILQGVPMHQIESHLDWLDAVDQSGELPR